MSDDYAWHQQALAGRKPPMHEGEPQCGFFVKKAKGGNAQPVAIWKDGTGMFARVGFKGNTQMVDPIDIWTWVCGHPIKQDDYWTAFEAGGWPNDMAPDDPRLGDDGVPLPGDNRPPAEPGSPEDISERIDNAIDLIRSTLVKDGALKVDSAEAAEKAANARDRLRQLSAEAEQARKDAKKPLDEAAKAVQQTWLPIKGKADDAMEKLSRALTVYLMAEQRRRDEEAAVARAQALEAVKVGAPVEEVAADLTAEPERVRVGGAVSGRRASLRTVKSAKITDYDALLAAIKEQPDIKSAVQSIADRSARANIALPGMEIVTEQKA